MKVLLFLNVKKKLCAFEKEDVPGEKSNDIEVPTVLSDQEIFLKKKVVKSCETKTLSYQMS